MPKPRIGFSQHVRWKILKLSWKTAITKNLPDEDVTWHFLEAAITDIG